MLKNAIVTAYNIGNEGHKLCMGMDRKRQTFMQVFFCFIDFRRDLQKVSDFNCPGRAEKLSRK